jgi:hypothetical protein
MIQVQGDMLCKGDRDRAWEYVTQMKFPGQKYDIVM